MEPIPFHKHTGNDGSPQIDPVNLLGFPIFTAVPTHTALEGTIVLVIITGTPNTYFIYTMLEGTWRGVNLPL